MAYTIPKGPFSQYASSIGLPQSCSTFINSPKDNDSGFGSYNEFSSTPVRRHFTTPVGKRPPCIGQEASPVINSCNYLNSALMSPAGLLRSDLETDWDNSELDVTSSTIADHNDKNVSRTVRHVVFLTHIKSCEDCQSGKECTVVSELESDMSSFFEIDCEFENKDTNVNEIKPLTHKNSSSSVETNGSDEPDFYKKNMCRQPVTTNRTLSKDKKKSIGHKLKQFKKFISKAGNRDGSNFKTLALL